MKSNVVVADKVLQLHDKYKKKDEANTCCRSSSDSKYKTDHAVIDTLSIEKKIIKCVVHLSFQATLLLEPGDKRI